MRVVHVLVKPTGPVFSQETGVLHAGQMRVRGVDYPFSHSVGEVDIFQNFDFSRQDATTLLSSKFVGSEAVLTKVDVKKAVRLWDSWQSDTPQLPNLCTLPPSAISISNGLVTRRQKKVKVGSLKEMEKEEEVEKEDDEVEDEQDDEEDDEDEDVQKCDEIISD